MKVNYLSHNIIIKTLGIVALVFLYACSGNQSDKKKLTNDLNQQKEEIIEELEKLEVNIDETIHDIEDKLNLNEGSVERNFEIALENLKKKKEDVKASITKAKHATHKNWASIKRDVNETMEDIEIEFSKVKTELTEVLVDSN